MHLDRFVRELHNISEEGYITTIRKGDTGVGHTLEQRLGLTENNLSLPDLGEVELKSFRKNTSSMLTMFTKEPISDMGRSRDRYLLNTFGYTTTESDRISNLYTTVSANAFNSQGFILRIENDRINLYHENAELNIYWTYELLKTVFERKMPKLVVVLADSIGFDYNESFHYNEAYYLEGFSFEGFISNIKAGNIKVDLRMHMKYQSIPRNHGTAFRIIKPALYDCFSIKKRIL